MQTTENEATVGKLQVPEVQIQSPNTPSKSRLDSQESSSPINSSAVLKSQHQLSRDSRRNSNEQVKVDNQVIQEQQQQQQQQGPAKLPDALRRQKFQQRISIMSRDPKLNRKRESKVSVNSSFSNLPDDASPGLIQEKQNKRILIQQQKQQQEQDEMRDEAQRDALLQKMKQKFTQLNLYPLDLFTVYDDANVDLQLRLSEFELALKTINMELSEEENRLIQKYFKVANKEAFSTIKLCFHLVENVGQMILIAVGYIIERYRMIPNLLIEEIASQDGMINVDSLKALNKEWEWGLDEAKLTQVMTSIVGSAKLSAQEFKLSLTKVPQPVDSVFNQEAYQNLVRLIINDSSVMQFSQLLQDQDQASSGEVALYIFIDILSIYIDRALSKLELMAIRVFLQKERDEEVVVYTKLLNDAIKIIDEDRYIKQQQTNKFKGLQLQIMQIYFSSILDKQTSLFDQYFKEGQTKIDKELFLQITASITGFQIDVESGYLIYQMIIEEKLDQNDPRIEIGEFTLFINKRKQELQAREKKLEQQENHEEKQIDLQQQAELLEELKQSLRENIKSSAKSYQQLSKSEVDQKSQQKDLNSFSQEPNEKFSIQSLKLDVVKFFEDLDVQKVKFLTQQQMFFGLLKIGIILKSKELFSQKSYDYYGFEKVIMQQMKLFYNSAKLIYNIKRELDLYQDSESNVINMQLLKLLFDKAKVNVKFEDVIFIYQTLDRERSGYIRLSDFFYLIYQHPQIEYRLNELLFRMKGYHENTLRAHRVFFAKLPFNCIRPYTDRANPPSFSFRIQPNLLGKFVVDPNRSTWELCKVKVIEGEGIPSSEIKNNCFRREVVVAIYDNLYQRLVQNSVTIKAKYDSSKEDVWTFPSNNRNNGFYLICENQSHKMHLIAIFELVCYYLDNNKVYKVSCGFGELPVAHLMKFGTFMLPLKGGTIEQVIEIKKEDIRCNRSGLAAISAKINGDSGSYLKISSSKRSRRPNLIKELETLPQLCLCHRNMTQIIYAYKRFCREKIDASEEVNTAGIEMFLFSLDCPYINRKMFKLWNRTMIGKMIGQEVGAFQILLGQLQKLIKLQNFNFNPYSTQEIFPPEVSKAKKSTINSILKYTEYLIDSSFFNRLGLQGDKILQEQIDSHSVRLQQGIFDFGQNQFDKFGNGLKIKGYDNYVQQML